MKTMVCDRCGSEYPAEYMLHCDTCDKHYCPTCARALTLCECAGELDYYQ